MPTLRRVLGPRSVPWLVRRLAFARPMETHRVWDVGFGPVAPTIVDDGVGTEPTAWLALLFRATALVAGIPPDGWARQSPPGQVWLPLPDSLLTPGATLNLLLVTGADHRGYGLAVLETVRQPEARQLNRLWLDLRPMARHRSDGRDRILAGHAGRLYREPTTVDWADPPNRDCGHADGLNLGLNEYRCGPTTYWRGRPTGTVRDALLSGEFSADYPLGEPTTWPQRRCVWDGRRSNDERLRRLHGKRDD